MVRTKDVVVSFAIALLFGLILTYIGHFSGFYKSAYGDRGLFSPGNETEENINYSPENPSSFYFYTFIFVFLFVFLFISSVVLIVFSGKRNPRMPKFIAVEEVR